MPKFKVYADAQVSLEAEVTAETEEEAMDEAFDRWNFDYDLIGSVDNVTSELLDD